MTCLICATTPLRSDLGRVCGLLKLRLTADDGSVRPAETAEIRELLSELSALQETIKEHIMALPF